MADPVPPHLGVARLAALAEEFLRDGGSLESVTTRRGQETWPAYRDRVRAQVDRLRAEQEASQSPDERLALKPSARDQAISAAIDLIDNGRHGLIARRNGELVGAAAIPWPESGLLELEWVGTKPNVRGAGCALIAAVLAGWPHPTALRLQSLPSAQAFYLSLGFQDEGKLKMVLPAPRVAALLAELPRIFGATGPARPAAGLGL